MKSNQGCATKNLIELKTNFWNILFFKSLNWVFKGNLQNTCRNGVNEALE